MGARGIQNQFANRVRKHHGGREAASRGSGRRSATFARPENWRMKSVTMNGKEWRDFDPQTETIRLPVGTARAYSVVAHY